MGKDTNDNYAELYAAIYKNAVRDDLFAVCGKIQKQLILKGVDKRKAIDYVSANKEYIKEQVRMNVYKESQEYGTGKTRRMQTESMKALAEQMINSYE